MIQWINFKMKLFTKDERRLNKCLYYLLGDQVGILKLNNDIIDYWNSSMMASNQSHCRKLSP